MGETVCLPSCPPAQMPSGQFPFNYPAATRASLLIGRGGISSARRSTVTRWGECRGKYGGEGRGGGRRQAKAIRMKRGKEERPAGGPNQVGLPPASASLLSPLAVSLITPAI